VTGVTQLVKVLRGPKFKEVNRELRAVSKKIATELRPEVVSAVRQSNAPQAWPMSETVRVVSDRVPVLSVGKVAPKFKSSTFRRPAGGAPAKLRRGAMAHGVVYGTKGGRRKGGGDYYQIPRDESGGALGRSMSRGRAMRKAQSAYLREYSIVLRRAGFELQAGRAGKLKVSSL
jgi:hypothetical protein